MKIAITQLGCIGDLVLATSAINMIKIKYPSASVDFIVGRKNHTIVKNNPNIANVIVYDKHPIKFFQFLIKLLSKKYDFYIDPKDHCSNESVVLAKIVNAKTKIGFNDTTKNVKHFDIGVPNEQANANKHFIEQVQNALLPLNIIENNTNDTTNTCCLYQKIKYRPDFYLDAKAVDTVNQFLNYKQIKSFILINISASNANKMWLPEKWIELIEFIKIQTNATIILSSDKPHKSIASIIATQTNILLFPPSSLQVIMALVAKAILLISPDTSLVHIASTFDIKQIVLANNVPAHLVKFAPLSSVAEVIISDVETEIYVPSITVEQVRKAFVKVQDK